MATLTVQTIVVTGLTESLVAAAGGGDEFVNADDVFIIITNGSGGSITLTIETPAIIEGDLAIAERTISIGAGATKLIGPFDKGVYNDSAGKVQLTYSGVTSLTVGVFQI